MTILLPRVSSSTLLRNGRHRLPSSLLLPKNGSNGAAAAAVAANNQQYYLDGGASGSRRTLTTYKFGVGEDVLQVIRDTLPVVGAAGPDFTKHFYKRMFGSHPELLNVFNQSNQAVGKQPQKLFKTVAAAATAAVETGELPGEAIEAICQKHCALNVAKEHYDVVGENLLATISETLTDDEKVLNAWGALYGDIAAVFTSREAEIYYETEVTPGGWLGKRPFKLEVKEPISDTIARFKFVPVDGKPTPKWKEGKYTTIWVPIDSEGIHGKFTEQPRHYTLAVPRYEGDKKRGMSISVKKEGLVSTMLHDSPEGTTFDFSAPYGCFDLSDVEQLWLQDAETPVVFISGGVGITPVLAMLENVFATKPTSWLHASNNGNVHAYRSKIREMASVSDGQMMRRVWYSNPTEKDGKPNPDENTARYHYTGFMNLSEPTLPPNLLHLDNPNTMYYMCGPPGFMDAQKEALQLLGVDAGRIHTEGF